MAEQDRPVVLITGAAGAIGSELARALGRAYTVVGLDLKCEGAAIDCREVDLSNEASVENALAALTQDHGSSFAAVIHLAAYFDFTGEDHPLYDAVNVEGTRNLIRALRPYAVERFIYSGTMLVHAPTRPGKRIDEDAPIAPGWAYPESKARAEAVIREERGTMPVLLLHLAGLYQDDKVVPTLAHQIARIFERDLKAHLYAGDPDAGQSFIHLDDMLDAFRRAVDRRADLPEDLVLLVGEPEALGYADLQDRIGRLIHGEDGWTTLSVPEPLAKAGAYLEEKAEPLVPDAIDHGEKPFIRPFMIDLASDHYALDITRARRFLGWEPRHDIRAGLKRIVAALKADPVGWYGKNGLTPPEWLVSLDERSDHPDALRTRFEAERQDAHYRHLWAPMFTAFMGVWLASSPAILGYGMGAMGWSDLVSGVVVTLLALASLSPRFGWARWANAAVGCWVLMAPLAFWTPSAAAYLNGTLVGGLIIALAALPPPVPGVSPAARMTGPDVPPGWAFSPSSWFQRLPIIALAVIGFVISRHMAAYQLGHIEGIWDPFFEGGPDPKNGSEEITTSWASEAWPVPDAGLGALVYMLEILVGAVGTTRRWRTMPWLVVLFGVMIVPLGVVSIGFIVIQPILLGTWCTVCLIAAAAMLVQIPYSLDELVATGQFLARRLRAGRSLLHVFFRGDTDDGDSAERDDFRRPLPAIVADMVGGGVSLPWTLALSCAIGVWLMFTRLTLGSAGAMADADHLVGALVLTVSITALAETGRAARLLNIPLGLALLVTPFACGADMAATVASIGCGAALVALAVPRGRITTTYGSWDRLIV